MSKVDLLFIELQLKKQLYVEADSTALFLLLSS